MSVTMEYAYSHRNRAKIYKKLKKLKSPMSNGLFMNCLYKIPADFTVEIENRGNFSLKIVGIFYFCSKIAGYVLSATH